MYAVCAATVCSVSPAQLPLQLSAVGIAPDSVGLRRAPKLRVARGTTPAAVTRDFVSDLHDYLLDERRQELDLLRIDLPMTPPEQVHACLS